MKINTENLIKITTKIITKIDPRLTTHPSPTTTHTIHTNIKKEQEHNKNYTSKTNCLNTITIQNTTIIITSTYTPQTKINIHDPTQFPTKLINTIKTQINHHDNKPTKLNPQTHT